MDPSGIVPNANQCDLALLQSRMRPMFVHRYHLLNILQIVLSGACLSVDTQI